MGFALVPDEGVYFIGNVYMRHHLHPGLNRQPVPPVYRYTPLFGRPELGVAERVGQRRYFELARIRVVVI